MKQAKQNFQVVYPFLWKEINFYFRKTTDMLTHGEEGHILEDCRGVWERIGVEV